jgi:hypothetical protein
MFDFVAARVPEGAGRDRLLQRHFAAELYGSAFEGFRIETDPTARADAFRRFREIVESYYTPGIAAALRPEARVLIHLIKQDRADAFGRYLDALAEAGPSALLAEGDTSYLRLPWFREPGQGLPDALFEVGARLRADCRVEPVVIGARGARFRATSRLGMRTGGPTGVTLIARPLASAEEASVPLAHTVADDESRQLVSADDAQALGRLVSALPAGTYDLFVRVAADGRWRERRVAECAPPPAPRRIVRAFPFWSAAKVGALQTTEGGKLRLRVLDMRSIAAAAGRSMGL